MNGMSLKNFQKTLVEYDEIEFSYLGVQYDFQKENSDTGLKISIWRSGDQKPRYCVKIENNLPSLEQAAQNLINAKILFDGKFIPSDILNYQHFQRFQRENSHLKYAFG